jgi:hypothetical protein
VEEIDETLEVDKVKLNKIEKAAADANINFEITDIIK